jgi:nucleotide-binding universal stress UspA family protein
METCARPADVLRLANSADLVVAGRRRRFKGLLAPLGADVRRLLRRSRTPLIVVGDKPKESYRRVVVATSLETDIAPALAWTRRIAPYAGITLLHVYRGLFEDKLRSAGVPAEQIMSHRVAARYEAALGMTALVEQHEAKAINRVLVAHGLAVTDVVARAAELDADLVVVVRSNHSWWIEALGASVSCEVATRSDCDVLVVHEPASSTPLTFADGAHQRAQ